MAPEDPTAAKARAFVALLVAGKYADAVASFDATMAAALPEPKLAETWAVVIQSAGAFDKIEAIEVQQVGGGSVAIVTCKFATARLDTKVAYKDGKVAGLFFAPTAEPYADPPYVKRTTFEERDVTVGSGEWALPGTLAMPSGKGPFRAVVLVHGSGPNDRDESVGANRPFKDLSGGLASRGIAVLRYEKRTKVHGGKLAKLDAATLDHETVDDALAAVEVLRATPGIDRDHIVVVGHSLGGQVAPRIAARSPNVAAIAILAGSTRAVADMMIEQMRYIGSLDPAQAAALAAPIAEVEKARSRVLDLQAGKPATPGERVLGAGAAYWQDLAKYDALGVAKRLARPIFVAQGGRDYQVTTIDFDAWKRALAGRKDVTFKLYPELNHIFGAGHGKSSPAEYENRTPVDQRLVDDLAAWLAQL